MIKVYGVPGWGSTISELMLTLADIPYQFVDVSGFDHEGASRELLKTLNPLCQVPTLALENDEIMTETAAIALMVLDRRPDLVILPSNSGHAAKRVNSQSEVTHMTKTVSTSKKPP